MRGTGDEDSTGQRAVPEGGMAGGRRDKPSVLRYLLGLFREAPSPVALLRSMPLGRRGGNRLVTSADGTTLSVRVSGEGTPVVLVHGTTGHMGSFVMIEPLLAQRFETWTYDRRGRGGSGDGPDYHLDREVEDLCAVLEAAGEPAHLLGHSFGAVVAYLAATRGAPVRSCVLYEPPLHAHRIPAGPLDQIAADIERGDRTGALRRFYLEVAGATTAEVELLERLPGVWKQLQETVRSLPREVNAVRELGWRPGSLPVSGAPVLLLNGEVTDAPAFATVEELCQFIPAADVAQLPGQGHLAMVFAPWTLAALAKAHFDRH